MPDFWKFCDTNFCEWTKIRFFSRIYLISHNNLLVIFANVIDGRGIIVGHLPIEIFRSCFFLILRGATLNCIITYKKYYRSPIVQGGLEILCKLRVQMVPTSQNRSIAAHFGSLFGRFYAEPTDEMVMGTFFEEKQSKKKQKTQKTL